MADVRQTFGIQRLGDRLRRLARDEDGFGFLELLIAMVVLNVGILTVVAGFSSGYTALKSSSRVSSATALADAQMERFRALQYTGICLSNTSTNTAYVGNAPTGTAVGTCTTTDPALVALRTPVAGPDSHNYRIDTYIVWQCITGTLTTSSPFTTSAPGCVTSGAAVAAPLKLIRVAVRDATTTSKIYAHEESTFDQSTGL